MKSTTVNGTLFLILLISLSGCFDFAPDFSGIGFGSGMGGGYNYDYTYDYPYTASFGVDSLIQENDSTFTIWAYIMYDSILIINQRTLRYYESMTGNGSISEVIQESPDTIDFKSLPDSIYGWRGLYEGLYQFSIPVTVPDTATQYTFCVDTEYLEKGVLLPNTFCVGY